MFVLYVALTLGTEAREGEDGGAKEACRADEQKDQLPPRACAIAQGQP